MTASEFPGAIRALLDEYKKAITELIEVIKPLNSTQLCNVADYITANPDCRSIQTVLTHVISSGYSYCVYIENSIGLNTVRPARQIFDHVNPYIDGLHSIHEYCKNVFIKNPGITIEQTDNAKKINTGWGQQYDVEQLLEHAIVHILRHRRQIENFRKTQNSYAAE